VAFETRRAEERIGKISFEVKRMPMRTKHQNRKMHPTSDTRKHEKQKTASNQQKPGKKPVQPFNASSFGQGLVKTAQNRSKAVEKASAVATRQGLVGFQADQLVNAIMNSYDSVVRGHVGVNRKGKNPVR
jgi:hypothetical protein